MELTYDEHFDCWTMNKDNKTVWEVISFIKMTHFAIREIVQTIKIFAHLHNFIGVCQTHGDALHIGIVTEI